MYRHYKSECQSRENTPTGTSKQQGVSLETGRDKEAWHIDPDNPTDTVKKCWGIINDQCNEVRSHTLKSASMLHTFGFKPVRIFVSSTFRDFHTERDILVKRVFPELKEWCEARKLLLLECDLRWGVPKDSTTRTTLCTCLEELDRCHNETNGEPFFLSLLCERYGWVPSYEDVPIDLQKEYQWVPNTSITTMEILHGAMRCKNPNALFCIRSNGFIQNLPEKVQSHFVESGPLLQIQMQTLKEHVRKMFPKQVLEYDCSTTGELDANGKPKFNIEDTFTKEILSFFKCAIDKKYPIEESADSDESANEDQAHDIYMKSKAAFVEGRHVELKTLHKYCDDNNDQSSGDSSSHVVVLKGPSGYGKSALLAKLIQENKRAKKHIFYHFISHIPSSQTPSNITKRLYNYIMKLNGKEAILQADANFAELLLESMKEYTGDGFIVVIDGINECSDKASQYHLSWLPKEWPPNVTCIISTDNNSVTTSRLPTNAEMLELKDLMVEDREKIASNYLGKYNKMLDKDQMKMLVTNKGSSLPLWLLSACEDLRIFGDFRRLTDHIEALPDTINGLMKQIINRLVQEDDSGLLKKTLCLLYCSKCGLPDRHAPLLLGDCENNIRLPPMQWANIRRLIKPFIRSTTHWLNGEEMIVFIHEVLSKVIPEFFMSKLQEEEYHRHLAGFYRKKDIGLNDYTIRESLPYHLLHGKLLGELIWFFKNNVLSLQMNSMMVREYLQPARCPNFIVDTSSTQMQWSSGLKLCQMCSLKHRDFNKRSTASNDKVCCICGDMILSKHHTKAGVCFKHKSKYCLAPGVEKCFVCENRILKNQACDVLLCNMCNVGIYFKKCCVYDM